MRLACATILLGCLAFAHAAGHESRLSAGTQSDCVRSLAWIADGLSRIADAELDSLALSFVALRYFPENSVADRVAGCVLERGSARLYRGLQAHVENGFAGVLGQEGTIGRFFIDCKAGNLDAMPMFSSWGRQQAFEKAVGEAWQVVRRCVRERNARFLAACAQAPEKHAAACHEMHRCACELLRATQRFFSESPQCLFSESTQRFFSESSQRLFSESPQRARPVSHSVYSAVESLGAVLCRVLTEGEREARRALIKAFQRYVQECGWLLQYIQDSLGENTALQELFMIKVGWLPTRRLYFKDYFLQASGWTVTLLSSLLESHFGRLEDWLGVPQTSKNDGRASALASELDKLCEPFGKRIHDAVGELCRLLEGAEAPGRVFSLSAVRAQLLESDVCFAGLLGRLRRLQGILGEAGNERCSRVVSD